MKTLRTNILVKSVLTAVVVALTACGSNQASFSIMGEQNTFSQTPTISYGKIDVLWVVDNSGSMASSQDDLINNMQSFTQEFWSRGIDFRMAVITTEAYRSLFTGDNSISEFRDGNSAQGPSGFKVVTPATPNGDGVLIKNVNQGINGTGDERAFQSFKVALDNSINSPYQFPRQDAYLSVVILSDEDDFSNDTSTHIGGTAGDMSVYNDSRLHPVSTYINYLDQKTGSTATKRNYSVNAIAVLDEQCRQLRNNSVSTGQRIGIRYIDIVDQTGGIKGSICGDFAKTLQEIAVKSISLAAKFYLNRVPNPDTIRVWVGGTEIFNSTTNGWTYDSADNSLNFHGSAVPGPGQQISVSFDPVSIK
jgi:hypothetical protein